MASGTRSGLKQAQLDLTLSLCTIWGEMASGARSGLKLLLSLQWHFFLRMVGKASLGNSAGRLQPVNSYWR
jgi:hypothetical protein